MKKWLILAVVAVVAVVVVLWGGTAYKRWHFLNYLNKDLAPALEASLSQQAGRPVKASLEKATEDGGAYTLHNLTISDSQGMSIKAEKITFANLELAWSGMPQKADVTLDKLDLKTDQSGGYLLGMNRLVLSGFYLNLDDQELAFQRLHLDSMTFSDPSDDKPQKPLLTDVQALNYRASWENGKIIGAADSESFVVSDVLVTLTGIDGISPGLGLNFNEMAPGQYNNNIAKLTASAQGKEFFVATGANTQLTKEGTRITFSGGVPSMTLTAANLPSKEGAQAMAQAGYETIQAKVQTSGSYDQQNGALAFDYKLEVNDAGSLRLNLGMNKVFFPESGQQIDPAQIMAVEMQGAGLCYKDDSAFNRILALAAQKEGKKPVEFQQAQVKELQDKAQAARQAGQMQTASFYEALAAFINQPDSLSISLTPPEPVALGRLATAGGMEGVWKLLVLGAGPCNQ